MIEPIKQNAGVSRANAVCDECSRRETVACGYREGGKGGPRVPDTGQIVAKLSKHGWSKIKGKLRCPQCNAKRKVVPMAKPKPAEMTARQKIEIVVLLADVYDIDAGRYKNGDTDQSVADVLSVPAGFVAQVREADFGPAGESEDMAALSEALKAAQVEIEEMGGGLEKLQARIEAQAKRVRSMVSDLDKIKGAVGGHVLKRAGVS